MVDKIDFEDLRRTLEILNMYACGRCGTKDKPDKNNRMHHSSGAFIQGLKKGLAMSTLAEKIILVSACLKDNRLNEDQVLDILFNRTIFPESETTKLKKDLELIINKLEEPWAKHSPEMGFVFDELCYPKYHDYRPIAIEVGYLHIPNCIVHGDDRLFMMGLIPVSVLKKKALFEIEDSEIPQDWGRDHPYFKYGTSSLRIKDWIFCYRHNGQPLEFKPHMRREMENLFEPIWDIGLINLVVRLVLKIKAFVGCYQ